MKCTAVRDFSKGQLSQTPPNVKDRRSDCIITFSPLSPERSRRKKLTKSEWSGRRRFSEKSIWSFVLLIPTEDISTTILRYALTICMGSTGTLTKNQCECAGLSSLCFLLIETGTEEEQNFAGVLDLIHKAKVVEGKEEEKSELDLMFDKRKEAAPKALSVQYYEEFKQAAGKTMQSILISTTTKLQYFKLENVRNLTFMDNISLETMGDKKVALFIVIPSTDTTYNFLAAMMYTQLFDTLYDRAINHFHGRLPVHVRFILDEFANVGKIPDFEKVLATCRKFEISAQVILQNLSQLKRMYEKSWEELPGNCDTLIYLGGKDQFTNEYLSKELGKETIDQLSINQTKGKQGSSSYNNAIMGRELATIDELTTMDNNNCIVMVRGLYPFFTNKFNLSEHPRYAELGEGWKPDAEKGETASDNPYVYYLDRYVDTQPETEFIDFSEFIDTGDTESADTIRLRFVTADDNGAEIEQTESIMSDIPAEIQKLLEHCTGLYNVA